MKHIRATLELGNRRTETVAFPCADSKIKQMLAHRTDDDRYTVYVDEPFPVQSGTRGTVVACDDGGNVLMEWDDGRTLALRPEVDRFRVLSQEECEDEEQEGVGPCQTMS